MSGGAKNRTPRKKQKHCTFCGSTDLVQDHHIGGRFHVAWFTGPLCKRHHSRITAAIRIAGVDMRYTPDLKERVRRARMATYVFLWMLDEFERERTKQ